MASSRVYIVITIIGLIVSSSLSFTHETDGIIICIGHINGLPGYVTAAPGESINITVNHEFDIEQCEKAPLHPSFSVAMPSINAGITKLDDKGKFMINFTVPKDAPAGIYKAELNITEGMTASMTREVMYVRVTDVPSNTYSLTVGHNVFEIPWHMETGKVSGMKLDISSKNLIIALERSELSNDYFLTTIPKKLVDDVTTDLTVMVNGKNVVYEVINRDEDRTFAIPLSNENNIEISGSYILPESQEDVVWSYDPASSIQSIDMSKDGSYLAASTRGEKGINVYLFNRDGEILWKRNIAKYYGPVHTSFSTVTISDDGSHVMLGLRGSTIGVPSSYGGELYYFDRNGQLLWNYTAIDPFRDDAPIGYGEHPPINSIKSSADGSYIAVTMAGIIAYFDQHGNNLWYDKIGYWISSVDVSSDGQYVVAAGTSFDYPMNIFFYNKAGRIWNYTTSDEEIRGFNQVAMTSDAERIAVAAGDLLLFNKNGDFSRMNLGTTINDVEISDDGSYIAACRGEEILFLDEAGNLLWNYTGAECPIKMSWDGSYLLAAEESSGPSILLFDKQGNILAKYATGNLGSLSIAGDGSSFAISAAPPTYYGGEIYLFDTSKTIPEFPFAVVIASVAIGVMIAIMRFRKL